MSLRRFCSEGSGSPPLRGCWRTQLRRLSTRADGTERMPILVALVIAIAIAGIVFGAAARHGRATDAADVRGDPASLGVNVSIRHLRWRRFLFARRDPTSETGLLLTMAVAGVAVAIVII